MPEDSLLGSDTPSPFGRNPDGRSPEDWLTPPGNREIETLRPARNPVNPDLPYHFLHEQEPGPAGVETVNTIFLTGKECSFKCLMCDLWKNTLPGPTPPGAIVRQLDHALSRLPAARSIKLYNNGNFFDPKSVPLSDHAAILERVEYYDRVIVENHPLLAGDACLRFRDGLTGTLEIAMGLETIHPTALPALNKQLTPEDFRRAAGFLKSNCIRVRAFVLLNPPYVTDHREGIRWALETVRFAFESGVDCCSIIATRPGNGIMETLLAAGQYVPPTLDALEEVFAEALMLAQGRLVFVDTWDIGFLSSCKQCFEARKTRLEKMNLTQTILQPIACSCHAEHV
jgi:archaeosine synthase beta-subunit